MKNTMKNSCLLVFLFIFFQEITFAQKDSLQNQAEKKIAPLLAFDSRNTFLALNNKQDNPVNLYGGRFGLRYKKWKFWLGFANIAASSKAPQKIRNQTSINPTVPSISINRELNLYFFTATPEYIFLYRKYLELSIPLEFGIGYANLKNINERDVVIKEQKGVFVPIESGINMLIKPTRWFGIIGRGGYRKTINVSGFNADYDGWYYSYSLAVFLGNIYRDLKRK